MGAIPRVEFYTETANDIELRLITSGVFYKRLSFIALSSCILTALLYQCMHTLHVDTDSAFLSDE